MRFEKDQRFAPVVHQARRAALAAVFGVAGTAARGVLGALIVGTLGVLVGVLVLVGGAVGGLEIGRASCRERV